jgi:hypothetical protein
MTLQKITLHFERDGFSADVHGVAAYVCPECNVRLVPGVVAEQVSAAVEALFKTATSPVPAGFPLPFSDLVFQQLAA